MRGLEQVCVVYALDAGAEWLGEVWEAVADPGQWGEVAQHDGGVWAAGGEGLFRFGEWEVCVLGEEEVAPP